jgi:hypothetical protein
MDVNQIKKKKAGKKDVLFAWLSIVFKYIVHKKYLFKVHLFSIKN